MSKILPMREDRVCCGSLFKIVYAASATNVDFFVFLPTRLSALYLHNHYF